MLIPSVAFSSNCDEAISFYKEAIGAEAKEVYYFRDAPPNHGMDESTPPNFVMHSEIMVFGTKVVMTDGGTEQPIATDSFYFTIFLKTDDEVASAFNKLADGGQVVEPLAQQFWASMSGFVKDKFGVGWSINTENPQ